MYSCIHTADIDECTGLQTLCEGDCTNNIGSFVCSCPEGQYLADNGLSCLGELNTSFKTLEVLSRVVNGDNFVNVYY